jgi:hypothetical protein
MTTTSISAESSNSRPGCQSMFSEGCPNAALAKLPVITRAAERASGRDRCIILENRWSKALVSSNCSRKDAIYSGSRFSEVQTCLVRDPPSFWMFKYQPLPPFIRGAGGIFRDVLHSSEIRYIFK